MSSSSLARNLVAARSACKLTQERLAEETGVSRATIAMIESGEADPQLSTLRKLAAGLKISPALLMLERSDIEAIEALQEREPAKLRDPDLQQIKSLLEARISAKSRKAASFGAVAAGAVLSHPILLLTGPILPIAGAVAHLIGGGDEDDSGSNLPTGARAGAGIGTMIAAGAGTVAGAFLGACAHKELVRGDRSK